MTPDELLQECGLTPGQLIETNHGLMEIQAIVGNRVRLGFLADGHVQEEDIDSVRHKLRKINKLD